MSDIKDFICVRIERVSKAYDSKNRIIEETYEYWYPKEKESTNIGFKTTKK